MASDRGAPDLLGYTGPWGELQSEQAGVVRDRFGRPVLTRFGRARAPAPSPGSAGPAPTVVGGARGLGLMGAANRSELSGGVVPEQRMSAAQTQPFAPPDMPGTPLPDESAPSDTRAGGEFKAKEQVITPKITGGEEIEDLGEAPGIVVIGEYTPQTSYGRGGPSSARNLVVTQESLDKLMKWFTELGKRLKSGKPQAQERPGRR